MAIDRVKTYFRQYGMEEKVKQFDVSSATVELAAQALSCEPARIAKTLSFMVEGHAILIVAAGGDACGTCHRRRVPVCGKRGRHGVPRRVAETL